MGSSGDRGMLLYAWWYFGMLFIGKAADISEVDSPYLFQPGANSLVKKEKTQKQEGRSAALPPQVGHSWHTSSVSSEFVYR